MSDCGTVIAVKIESFVCDLNGNTFSQSMMEDVKRNAIHEATIHQQMEHTNIIHMHEYYICQGCVVMHMEYFDGEELEGFLVNKETRIGEEDARKIFTQLSAAVMYIHSKGVVHGDLHMGNVMINDNKDVKVIDFGNALSGKTAVHMDVLDKFWFEKIGEILLFKLDYPTRVGEHFADLLSEPAESE